MSIGLAIKKQVKSPRKKKWSFGMFIFWGFNFIVGYAFIVGLNSSFSHVGTLFPVIILFSGFIAFVTGLSFSRLSNSFHTNGGIYLYCKKVFGRKTGVLAGFFQYIQEPFVALSSFFGMLWAFQGIIIKHHATYTFEKKWFIGFLAILIVVGAYLVTSYGFFSTSISLYFLWFLKWAVIIFSIFLCFYSIKNGHFGTNIVSKGMNLKHIGANTKTCIESTITFFFAFGGFEGIAIISNDIENPKKNMGRALIVIMVLAFLFYIFYFYMILGTTGAGNIPGKSSATLAPNYNKHNPSYLDFNALNYIIGNTLFKGSNGGVLGFGISGVMTFVIIIVTLSELANKATSRIQNGWVNSRMIAELARDGFFPLALAKRDRYFQLTNALSFDLLITTVLIIIFYPIYLSTKFNISDALSLYTICAFIQYLFGIAAILKHWNVNKKVKLSMIEVMMYVIVFVIILFLLVAFMLYGFIDGITGIYHAASGHSHDINSLNTLITTLTIIISGIVFYVVYSHSKKKGWPTKAKKWCYAHPDVEIDGDKEKSFSETVPSPNE